MTMRKESYEALLASLPHDDGSPTTRAFAHEEGSRRYGERRLRMDAAGRRGLLRIRLNGQQIADSVSDIYLALARFSDLRGDYRN